MGEQRDVGMYHSWTCALRGAALQAGWSLDDVALVRMTGAAPAQASVMEREEPINRLEVAEYRAALRNGDISAMMSLRMRNVGDAATTKAFQQADDDTVSAYRRAVLEGDVGTVLRMRSTLSGNGKITYEFMRLDDDAVSEYYLALLDGDAAACSAIRERSKGDTKLTTAFDHEDSLYAARDDAEREDPPMADNHVDDEGPEE
jgi:hypothetical protein